MNMTKVGAKFKAIELRRAGHSYNFIAPVVGVSKSTLSIWLADVPYSPNEETIERVGKARAASGAAKNKIKLESFTLAREEAVREIGALSDRDLLMLGLGLYIGEGTKSSITTCIVNSNPAIINLIIRWLTESLGLTRKHITLRIHLYPDSDIEKSLAFWSETTQIPRSQFLKTIIDVRKDKKIAKAGKLPYGTADLRVISLGEKKFGVFLARKLLACSAIALHVEELRV